MGLNIDYEVIANYILTYSELKKQRKLLEQISKDVSDIKDRYL